ncbi:MAG: UvrD-helicase domain-containing protein [Silvanigrellaceae bacterium]|nr:UvrD-helicase domain-containing protein [Silvanigrellaceae bacterium]
MMKPSPIGFTQEQLECIKFHSRPGKPHLVIEAGAGAGKTQVLIQRIRWLLFDQTNPARLDPYKLLVVTFSKNADTEIKERIEKLLSEQQFNLNTSHMLPMNISTIDSLFAQLVEILYPLWWEKKQAGSLKKMPTRLHLVEEKEFWKEIQDKIFEEIAPEKISTEKFKKILDFILSGALKKQSGYGFDTMQSILAMMTKDVFLCIDFSKVRLTGQKIHPASLLLLGKLHKIAKEAFYYRLLQGEMTFADRIVLLHECFFKYQFSSPFALSELIVDEYQDTNQLQHDILYYLVQSNGARMVVVGDPKQSIYGFRNASVDVFKKLASTPSWHKITLQHNFRSQEELLEEINFLSSITFQWKKKLNENFIKSQFYLEAESKYIKDLPLLPASNKNTEFKYSPTVEIVTSSLNKKRLVDNSPLHEELNFIKFKDYQLWAITHFIQKFIHEKRNADPQTFQWSDVVILCETRKQIALLSCYLKEAHLPISIDEQTNAESVAFEQRIAGILVKLLFGYGSVFDLYLCMQSPLLSMPHQAIEDIFYTIAQKKPIKNLEYVIAYKPNEKIFDQSLCDEELFAKFLECVVTYQPLAKRNLFAAWQILRWQLTKLHINNANKERARIFVQQMDSFASVLDAKAHLSPKKICEGLDEWLFPQQNTTQDTNEDNKKAHTAIRMKTVHSAKGLEWPYVIFWPKFENRLQNTDFTMMTSSQTLDITWLQEDREKLSVIKNTDNPLYPEADFDITYKKNGEVKELLWFSTLRKLCEENYERQRVFYTAFTRAKKNLVLLQPLLSHGKSGFRDEIEKSKIHLDNPHDNLTKHLFACYLKKYFNFESKKNEIPEPWFQSNLQIEYVSQDNTVRLHEYGPSFIFNFLESLNKNSKHQKENFQFQQSSAQLCFEQQHLGPQIEQGIDWDFVNKTIPPCDDSCNSLETSKEFLPVSLLKKLEQKRNQRQKAHKGNIYHCRMENTQTSSAIQVIFKKIALHAFHELELWSHKNEMSTQASRNLPEISKNVIDFLAIVSLAKFLESLSSAYFENNSTYSNLLQEIGNAKKNSWVILILDFKSGKDNTQYEEQIKHYLHLSQKLVHSTWGKLFLTRELRNSETNYIFIGGICFKNKIKKYFIR